MRNDVPPHHREMHINNYMFIFGIILHYGTVIHFSCNSWGTSVISTRHYHSLFIKQHFSVAWDVVDWIQQILTTSWRCCTRSHFDPQVDSLNINFAFTIELYSGSGILALEVTFKFSHFFVYSFLLNLVSRSSPCVYAMFYNFSFWVFFFSNFHIQFVHWMRPSHNVWLYIF